MPSTAWIGSHVRALVLIVLSALAPTAHAYLDPGTGVLVLQAAIGAIAGALVALRLYWSKVKSGLSRLTGGRVRREPADRFPHTAKDGKTSENDAS